MSRQTAHQPQPGHASTHLTGHVGPLLAAAAQRQVWLMRLPRVVPLWRH